MKINKNLKRNIIILLLLMYATGSSMWLLETFFQIDNGFGPEPRAQQIWLLRLHGTLSYGFVLLMGYVLRAHVLPYWRIQKGLKTGLPLLLYIGCIFATVPFMLYLTDNTLKGLVEQTHAYLGLGLLVPFIVHLVAKKYRSN